jgi:hypothetical protein
MRFKALLCTRDRWVPAKATRDQAYEHLNLRVPDDVKCVNISSRLCTLL